MSSQYIRKSMSRNLGKVASGAGLRLASPARPFSHRALPAEVPDSAIVKLSRRVLAVHGPDASKFLNGLLTVRPPDNPESSQPVGSYAGLLNAKGRVVADLFVYSAHSTPWIRGHLSQSTGLCYLLDVDAGVADRVQQTLNFYKLMSDVTVEPIPLESWATWDDIQGSEAGDSAEGDASRVLASKLASVSDMLRFSDYRVPSLGDRLLVPEGALELLDVGTEGAPGLDIYNIRRYLFGVPEGPSELIPEKALPLEYCMDFMNGVDFNKGCYVGQELTIRTHHHGVVRKRVVPVVYTAKDGEIPETVYEPNQFEVTTGDSIVDNNPIPDSDSVASVFSTGLKDTSNPFGASSRGGRPAGTVVAALGNVGLASLRIDRLGHRFSLGDTDIHPLTPYWWPEVPQSN